MPQRPGPSPYTYNPRLQVLYVIQGHASHFSRKPSIDPKNPWVCATDETGRILTRDEFQATEEYRSLTGSFQRMADGHFERFLEAQERKKTEIRYGQVGPRLG
jgi:hypothetical protein